MKLHVLGAGQPTPAKERFGTSFVLELGDEYLMFDCGPAATHKLVKTGIQPTEVDYLFITHHHFDHVADYPCFLLTRWDQGAGKARQLQVYGPPPTAWVTDRLIGEEGAFSPDWKARVGHPVSQEVYQKRGGTLPRSKPSVDVRDVDGGVILDNKRWKVTAAPAQHVEPWLKSLAYRVESDEGSIVFAVDTARCESVENLARNSDILVISCPWHEEVVEERGHAEVICGTLSTAQLAVACNVKKLVLGHTGGDFASPGSREKAIGDIARVFSGEIFFADELMSLAVA
jgi:ribonuclease Z